MAYTDAQLEAMLADLESDRVERKASFEGDAPTKVREAVCAFANDLPNHGVPGVVFIGAHDDGSPSGTSVTDRLLLTLADIKTDGNILPPPTLGIEKRTLRGAETAVITVTPADSPPVRYRGRVWVRIGPRRGIATAQDERILNEKRRYRDRPYDVQPAAQATLSDLDLPRFEREYVPAAVAPDVLQANERTLAQRLAATKMTTAADAPVPTVLGVLVTGKAPRDILPCAYVQFLRVQGTELGDTIIDEALIDGTIADVVRRLDEKLAAHNFTSVDLTSEPTERRAAPFSLAALQQLTRNAVLHRTYEGTNAPVRVTWFRDRIEIINPGGPFGEVTAQNFGAPGITDYRNPNLAEAMRTLGFVQKFGAGIATARFELKKNGNPPPELRPEHGHVLVIVRAAP